MKTMICFSGCLMSSASIQKLFCGIYSALKCSFDEFVREKVFSSFYSSAILGPPPMNSAFFPSWAQNLPCSYGWTEQSLAHRTWAEVMEAASKPGPKKRFCIRCSPCFCLFLVALNEEASPPMTNLRATH